MKTSLVRFFIVALAAIAVIGSANPASAAITTYNFEAGSISPWVLGSDPGAGTPGLSVQPGDSFGGGFRHAELRTFGPFMPGSGLWMYSRHSATAGTPVTVTLRFAVKNKLNCLTCKAMAWIGDGPVASSASFTTLGPIPTTTWTVYTFSKTIVPASGVVGVAVGWVGTPAGSPTKVAFDLIDVGLTP